MAVDPKYITTVGGRSFVLFAGLLDLAHQQGLQAISTELRQLPHPENGNLAVVHAVVVMKDERRFSGTGDASPANVGKMIAPHIVRMAETRSIARALRLATNVGMTAFEELGDDDSAPAPVTPLREAQQQAKPQYQPQGQGPKPASEKQVNYLKALLSDHGDDAQAKLESKLGKKLEQFTSNEARKWIEQLKGKTG